MKKVERKEYENELFSRHSELNTPRVTAEYNVYTYNKFKAIQNNQENLLQHSPMPQYSGLVQLIFFLPG